MATVHTGTAVKILGWYFSFSLQRVTFILRPFIISINNVM
jgi:hypothetical protein